MPASKLSVPLAFLFALASACGEPRRRSLDPVTPSSPTDARMAGTGGTAGTANPGGIGGEAGTTSGGAAGGTFGSGGSDGADAAGGAAGAGESIPPGTDVRSGQQTADAPPPPALSDAPVAQDSSPDAPPPAPPDGPDPCASLPPGGCCRDTDCAAVPSMVATCDVSRRRCGYSCAPDTKPCGNACIPRSACCTDQDCGRCEKCSSRSCEPQTASEDRKNDCLDGVSCKTGRCDGRGGCGDSPNGSQTVGCGDPASCDGVAQTTADSCQNGGCRRGDTTPCPRTYYGCSNNRCADRCPSDRPFDTGSECIACGGPGQKCCLGAREDRCRSGSWCCDSIEQKGCEGQAQLLNTCVRQLNQGDDCNVLRNDQCQSGTKCEFDVNICCLPCTGTKLCDNGGICRESIGAPCRVDTDCLEGLVCRFNTEMPARLVCQIP